MRRGTIHALIGPNGAGKTTCFNLITKFLQPTAGQDPLQGPGHHARLSRTRWRALGLVRSFQISAVFPHLTRAGERARRAAADARHLLSFLALGALGRSAERPRAASCWTMWA